MKMDENALKKSFDRTRTNHQGRLWPRAIIVRNSGIDWRQSCQLFRFAGTD